MTLRSRNTSGGRTRAALIVLATTVALVAAGVGSTSDAAVTDPGTARSFPAPIGGCYTPAGPTALAPNQIGALYDLAPLWKAGHKGQGKRVAILDLGEVPNRDEFDKFESCFGISTPLQVQVVGDGPAPDVGGEASLDVMLPLIAAPELAGVYVFAGTQGLEDGLLEVLRAALDPANTGGVLVDAVSTSFSICEPALVNGTAEHTTPGYVDEMNALLQHAAELGVTVFADAADGGSSACAKWPVEETNPEAANPAAAFPASSPWSLAVGGTQFEFHRNADGSGEVTTERVWNEPSAKDAADRIGGGGEASIIYPTPSWQEGFAPGPRHSVPDVAGLAGTPYYSWSTDDSFWDGTSAATPFTAGGWLVVLSALESEGIGSPGFLAPILYELARTHYSTVFRDITVGNNDLWGLVGCCDATAGYDQASGLGSLRFAGLASVLSETLRPATTTTSTPPAAAVVPRFTG